MKERNRNRKRRLKKNKNKSNNNNNNNRKEKRRIRERNNKIFIADKDTNKLKFSPKVKTPKLRKVIYARYCYLRKVNTGGAGGVVAFNWAEKKKQRQKPETSSFLKFQFQCHPAQ